MDSFLAWDCLLSSKNPEKQYLGKLLNSMLEVMNGELNHIFTHECNMIMKGQSRSRAGSIGGLRLIFDTSYEDEEKVESIVNRLRKSEVDYCDDSGSFYSGANVELPLRLDSISELPSQGIMVVSVQFTNGYGATEAKAINSIRQNQAKETKNWLNYSDLSKNKAYVSGELLEELKQPYWYLVKHPESDGSGGGACGGAYQLSYDLDNIIDALVEASVGVWWNKVSDHENPRINFDSTERLPGNNPIDPHNWYLHSENVRAKIEQMLKVEEGQSGADSMLFDDIQYNSERMTKQRWPVTSFTAADGLAAGFEESMVNERVITPLVKREFFHNIGMFLYTRAPKYWRNGEGKIWIINRIP